MSTITVLGAGYGKFGFVSVQSRRTGGRPAHSPTSCRDQPWLTILKSGHICILCIRYARPTGVALAASWLATYYRSAHPPAIGGPHHSLSACRSGPDTPALRRVYALSHLAAATVISEQDMLMPPSDRIVICVTPHSQLCPPVRSSGSSESPCGVPNLTSPGTCDSSRH
jgi:hypothetical protein